MISIVERKIAGLSPRWAEFAGFSILFDGPPESYVRKGEVEVLNASEAPGFLAGVREGMQLLKPYRLLQTYLFCALPAASYHVTAFDVGNVSDLPTCQAAVRDALERLLARVPTMGGFGDPLLRNAETGLLSDRDWNLRFVYGSLHISGTVLVIRLLPVENAPYQDFVAARAELSREYRTHSGIGAKERFTPHLSLGYFANPEGAELASAKIGVWDQVVRSTIGDAELKFESASLHGFTDMATFYRKAD